MKGGGLFMAESYKRERYNTDSGRGHLGKGRGNSVKWGDCSSSLFYKFGGYSNLWGTDCERNKEKKGGKVLCRRKELPSA